jgi:hypothetical protein
VSREKSAVDPDLEVLLERGRIVRPVPDVVRARAMARARAAVAAAAAAPPDARFPAAAPARGHRLRFAVAASLVLIGGAAGAAAALLNHARGIPEPAALPEHRAAAPARKPAVDLAPLPPEPAPAVAPVAPPARIARHARPLTPQESYAAELDLLHRAQAAHAGHNFARALALAAEHGRRFPNGRLAEEREALRVRSLAASGRSEEARRAAAAFAHRFPRSVLLPRLLQGAEP